MMRMVSWTRSGRVGLGRIITAQTGEAITAVLSADYTNTGSFSPRADQIHNPYDFSFNTGPGKRVPLFESRPPDSRLLVQPGRLRHSCARTRSDFCDELG